MDKCLEKMNKVYEIAQNVFNYNGWHKGHKGWCFTDQSIPRKCNNGYEIVKIQYGKDGEYSDEVNGIEAIADYDEKGINYFLIGALCDDPETLRFDASDIEIAAMIGRCAQVTEDFLGDYSHAWQ